MPGKIQSNQRVHKAPVSEVEKESTSFQKANTIYNIKEIQSAFFDYNGKKVLKLLGAIPAKPNLFIGRGNDTADIYQRLTNKDNLLLLVNGVGGIGKTTMAAQYYFEYFEHYAHLIWLVSEKGIKEALVSLALSLRLTFDDQLNQQQQIEEIIRNVSELEKPVLLIIDNANNLTDLDENFQLLRQFQNTHILITSRINDYPNIKNYKVNHLDKQSANELFKYHFKAFKAEEQALLDELLDAIGYNTLVIELISKNLNEFNNDIKSHYPLKKLLEDIQAKGVLSISKSTKVNTDYKLEPATPEAIISTMYDVSPLTENEKHILSIFAVLPATAIPFTYLEAFLTGIEALDRELITLSNKGWIEYDKTFQSFKTNPIISEIARTQNKDRLECDTLPLINFLNDKLVYDDIGHIEGDFENIKKLVTYAETFINNFEIINTKKSALFDNVGNFYKTYGNLSKGLFFFEDGLKISKELNKSQPNNASVKHRMFLLYFQLGYTNTCLGNLGKALMYYKDLLILVKGINTSDSQNIAFKSTLGIVYSKLGLTHCALGNLDQALLCYNEQLKFGKQLYEDNPNNLVAKNQLAASYRQLGDIHAYLGNLDQALIFFENNVRLMKGLHESNLNDLLFKVNLAAAYKELGSIQVTIGNFKKALKSFKCNLKLAKELSKFDPNNTNFKIASAISHQKLGETHFSLENFKKALRFCQDGKELFEELQKNNSNNTRIKNDLSISYAQLGKIHVNLGELGKAVGFFVDNLGLMKELNKIDPNNVTSKYNLGFAYLELGKLFIDHLSQPSKGLQYLNLAKGVYASLANNHPTYADFKKNYNWVVKKIESIT